MNYLKNEALRLAATYLTIIMAMSIGFSIVLFATSSQELGRRPRGVAPGMQVAGKSLQQYFDQREQESQAALALDLMKINVVTLVSGGFLSYLLAVRTLRPIEENMSAQLQFVSDASHELRTPLTALRTANEVALRNKKLTLRAARQVISENVNDVARLHKLTDSMLGLLHSDNSLSTNQRVALVSVMKESLNLVTPQALSKNITITDTLHHGFVRGDEQRLIQLFTILLDNAIKYSPAGSTILVGSSVKGKTTTIFVRDEGIGMDEITSRAIFSRFFRADTSRSRTEGYGLGLAIADKIVKSHHGSIYVRSELGIGSTFYVRLQSA